MPEEENWGQKALIALGGVPCIPRAQILLPGDDDAVVRISQGRFGPIYKTKENERSLHVLLLPLTTAKNREGADCWDEEMFRSLETVLRPSASTHINVASVAGFVQTNQNLCLIYSSGEGRPLKEELLKLRTTARPVRSARSLILCAMGVAEGLFHLHSYKVYVSPQPREYLKKLNQLNVIYALFVVLPGESRRIVFMDGCPS